MRRLFILIFVLCVSAAAQYRTPDPVAAGMKRYTNDKCLFQFDYPQKFTIKEKRSKTALCDLDLQFSQKGGSLKIQLGDGVLEDVQKAVDVDRDAWSDEAGKSFGEWRSRVWLELDCKKARDGYEGAIYDDHQQAAFRVSASDCDSISPDLFQKIFNSFDLLDDPEWNGPIPNMNGPLKTYADTKCGFSFQYPANWPPPTLTTTDSEHKDPCAQLITFQAPTKRGLRPKFAIAVSVSSGSFADAQGFGFSSQDNDWVHEDKEEDSLRGSETATLIAKNGWRGLTSGRGMRCYRRLGYLGEGEQEIAFATDEKHAILVEAQECGEQPLFHLFVDTLRFVP